MSNSDQASSDVETSDVATPDGNEPVSDLTPAKTAERIGSLDLIRGLAVMGILAANIVAFGQPFSAYMFPEAFLVPAADPGGWQWITQFVLIDGKMRGLFTVLFGAGLYLFMERAWGRGATRWLQARRLVILLLFGIVHFFFIWRGDILMFYALAGLLALPFLKWAAKTQLMVGIIGYVLGAIAYAAIMAPLPFVADTPFGDQPEFSEMRADLEQSKLDALALDAESTELKQSGDYVGLTAHRFAEHGFDPLVGFSMFVLETLPLIFIGIAIYRLGFFSGEIDRRSMIMWGWIGLLVGAALHLLIALWVKSLGFSYYGSLAGFMGVSPLPRLAMVLGLASLLVVYSPGWTGWLGQRIAAAGRAAFTNYLGTSIVMLFVFHGWAFGLFGELNRPQLYLVMALTWVLILAWSKPWLERYRYGPLEWLWRCMTYGRLFPLKR